MKNKSFLFILVTVIIILGAFARFIPHFPNFAPMGAIALFAIAFYKRSILAISVTTLLWWATDFYLNNFVYELSEGLTFFTSFQLYTLLSLISIVGLGKLLFSSKITLVKGLVGSLGASLLFFIITNFGVWMQGTMYPMTFEGLITCYQMAIPFYRATLSSDLIFTALFFGIIYVIQRNTSRDFNLELA